MKDCNILIIGGGIGGLTAAIALGKQNHRLTIIEKDPDWAVYGVGIIQQANVIRAAKELGILDDYIAASFAFDYVEVFLPDGRKAATVPAHRLVEGYPASVGITRPALHEVLGRRAKEAGATIRLGITAESLVDDGNGVDVQFSDGSTGRYDIVIGADGLHSKTRSQVFPAAAEPEFTGQAVWRYNLPRPDSINCLQAFDGPNAYGFVPLSPTLMYMFVTTPEPGNPRFETHGLARRMRDRLGQIAPAIVPIREAIVDDEAVVYRPLEWQFLDGAWHKGRVALLGDAAHATTPHLGQGAGMAIEDSIVLAEEIGRHSTPEAAFKAYHDRRFERCRYIVEKSLAICRGQLGMGPKIEQAGATKAMFDVTAQPL